MKCNFLPNFCFDFSFSTHALLAIIFAHVLVVVWMVEILAYWTIMARGVLVGPPRFDSKS